MSADPAQQACDLAAQIDRHRGLYARGIPELVDADYDALEEELRTLLAAHPDVALDDNDYQGRDGDRWLYMARSEAAK